MTVSRKRNPNRGGLGTAPFSIIYPSIHPFLPKWTAGSLRTSLPIAGGTGFALLIRRPISADNPDHRLHDKPRPMVPRIVLRIVELGPHGGAEIQDHQACRVRGDRQQKTPALYRYNSTRWLFPDAAGPPILLQLEESACNVADALER